MSALSLVEGLGHKHNLAAAWPVGSSLKRSHRKPQKPQPAPEFLQLRPSVRPHLLCSIELNSEVAHADLVSHGEMGKVRLMRLMHLELWLIK